MIGSASVVVASANDVAVDCIATGDPAPTGTVAVAVAATSDRFHSRTMESDGE